VSKHYHDSPGSSSDITILGIGNLLMGDEGIGIHTLNTLRESYAFSPDINFIDGGTTGLDLIPFFENCKKMIIIDAVDFQKEPGYIESLNNDEIQYRFNTKLSLHHAGLSDVLSVLQLQDIPFPEMVLIGVQPKVVELGMELSDVIKEKHPNIISNIIDTLTKWGIECSPVSS
jgi:hydrogenase maturation protease